MIPLLALGVSCGIQTDEGTAATAEPTAEPADEKTAVIAENIPIHEDQVFFYTVAEINGEDLEKLGFDLGDSIDLSFSNGKTFKDVPYHNGYYVKVGGLVAVAYPGIPGISIAYNLGDGTFKAFELDEDDQVTIILNEKGKYLKEQELFSQTHSDDPNDFASIEIFCNFRTLEGGKLKKDWIYRSASMTNNGTNRASYVDDLLEKYGIRTVVDLSDTEETLEEYRAKDDWNSDYFDKLNENGDVMLVGLSVNPSSESFRKQLTETIYEMIHREGPYLINCTEGKDRTGYAACLLEALAGATYEEIRADYLKTYEYFYNITEETSPESVQAAIDASFDPIMEIMFCTEEGDDIHTLNYAEKSREFCKNAGLTDAQIDEIVEAITE